MSWGAIAAGVVTAGAGAYAGSKNKGAGQVGGVATTTMPQYSWTEPTQRTTADFVTQNIQRMAEGKYPAWYNKLAPQVRESMQKQEHERAFGVPGERVGTVGESVVAGANMGTGAAGTTRRKRQAVQDYADRASLIDQYMATQGMNIMSTQSTQWPTIAAQLPGGPNAQVTPYSYSTPEKKNPWGEFATNVAGNMPWENMFSSTSTPTPSPTPSTSQWPWAN